MASRNWLITLVLAVLCGGILVLLTDVEVSLVRWVNCGPFSTAGERSSEECR